MPTFYRITVSDPPTLYDFLSDKERGKPEPLVPEHAALWEGLSVMDQEDRARKLALRYPNNGPFIAVIVIEEDGPVQFARTLRRPGHYTLYGDAQAILDRVQLVIPV